MISTLEVRKHSRSSDNQTYHLSVTSFIRMDSSDVKSIKCQHSPSISDSMDVEVMGNLLKHIFLNTQHKLFLAITFYRLIQQICPH